MAAAATAAMDPRDFFRDYGEANRYTIKEVIGKGSYGVVCSAVDNFTGERVAIKKITNVFEHVSDATRILREIKLLRLLKHPDIVEIKRIMLPPSLRDFKDIYVVFELMETDLHQVIKANDDLTHEHHQFFLYQMLRGLKYIHSANVYHRDLKPKNILANADCKLKICDFGLARPAFDNAPTSVFWTDYVATRWYRAPELCGSFYSRYTPAIDTWSVGCIFAEVLAGCPLFPGRNVVHQLELITDCLGTPTPEVIAKVRNEKARRFLSSMRHKPPVSFDVLFPKAEPAARALLRRLLSFDPAERPSAEEALADPYFANLHCSAREPAAVPVCKASFEFERRKLCMDEVRELIYREILEYHPQALEHYLGGGLPSFLYPSALDSFKRQFMFLEGRGSGGGGGSDGGGPAVGAAGRPITAATSLPRERVREFQAEAAKYSAQHQQHQQLQQQLQQQIQEQQERLQQEQQLQQQIQQQLEQQLQQHLIPQAHQEFAPSGVVVGVHPPQPEGAAAAAAIAAVAAAAALQQQQHQQQQMMAVAATFDQCKQQLLHQQAHQIAVNSALTGVCVGGGALGDPVQLMQVPQVLPRYGNGSIIRSSSYSPAL